MGLCDKCVHEKVCTRKSAIQDFNAPFRQIKPKPSTGAMLGFCGFETIVKCKAEITECDQYLAEFKCPCK